MSAPQVTRHTSIQYSSSYHTCVYMGALIFFTVATMHSFRSARSGGTGGMYPICSTEHSSCQKYLFSFAVVVNNSIKVGPLVFLL
jgi:hypothetical protein